MLDFDALFEKIIWKMKNLKMFTLFGLIYGEFGGLAWFILRFKNSINIHFILEPLIVWV